MWAVVDTLSSSTAERDTHCFFPFSFCVQFNSLSVPVWLSSSPPTLNLFLLPSIIVRSSISSGSISALHNKGFFVGIQGPFWLLKLMARSPLWWHPEMTRMDSTVTSSDSRQNWWIDKSDSRENKYTNRLREMGTDDTGRLRTKQTQDGQTLKTHWSYADVSRTKTSCCWRPSESQPPDLLVIWSFMQFVILSM